MTLYEFLSNAIDMESTILNFGSIEKAILDMGNKDIRRKENYLVRDGVLQVENISTCSGQEFQIKEDNIFPDVKDWKKMVEELYRTYKFSKPSSIKDSSFKALSADEMTDKQLDVGENRLKALQKLKLAIILGNVSGVMKWNNPNHWFWISKNEPDLILYRKWF